MTTWTLSRRRSILCRWFREMKIALYKLKYKKCNNWYVLVEELMIYNLYISTETVPVSLKKFRFEKLKIYD